jgi:hypothetical protein
MAVYRFKVSFEDYDVVREIEIKTNQTFEDLHNAIHASIKYDNMVSASFYVSNDQWLKGEEVAFMPTERKIQNGVKLMKDVKLAKLIEDPHQKFYYISNFNYPFDFHVELVDILLKHSSEETAVYPYCVRSEGDAPPQFKKVKTPVIVEEEKELTGEAALLAALNGAILGDIDDEPEDINEDEVMFGIDAEDYDTEVIPDKKSKKEESVDDFLYESNDDRDGDSEDPYDDNFEYNDDNNEDY